ncbi:hypothetical protein [Desulfobacula sp.]|jgi:hypothetical protein|uniref:hypothetical protein n=1 Tax=Desulfobacula sp. TaxID=2593537 RepID=UPI0039B82F2F|nr:hypothetical protein [Desulfobacula sp.]MBT7793426.1 hypothetical protein [Desulfobacula sp.]
MATLTENGYDYYKSKKYWTPSEAAGFVSGVQFTSAWLHVPKDYDEISLVLNASIEAFKNKKLKVFKELKRRSGTNYKDFYEKYCPDFCRYDDVYQIYYLSCFEPLEYMKWIVTEKINRIPYIIGVTVEDGLKWNTPPSYNKDKPVVHAIKSNTKLNRRDALYYKRLEDWTISDGVHLSQGEFPGGLTLFRNHVDLIEKLHKVGKIKAVHLIDGNPVFSSFVLLDNWKKAGLDISPLFDFTKKTSESGDVEYSWVDSDAEETSTEELCKKNFIQNDMENTNIAKSASSTESTAPKIEKPIDYSLKTKNEQAELVRRWKEEKKTRREIAILLFKKEYENGYIKIETLMKRVDRLK